MNLREPQCFYYLEIKIPAFKSRSQQKKRDLSNVIGYEKIKQKQTMQRNSINKQKVDFIDFSLLYIQVCLKITQFLGALPDGKTFYPNVQGNIWHVWIKYSKNPHIRTLVI